MQFGSKVWCGLAAPCVALALCGCGGGGPEQTAREAAAVAASAQLVAETRAAGAIPAGYTADLASQLNQELTALQASLPPDRATRRARSNLEGVLARIASASRRNDRGALRYEAALAGGLRREFLAAARQAAAEGGR